MEVTPKLWHDMFENSNNREVEHLAIENIFGKPPRWILNWGITLIIIFFALIISISAFIKYPDKLLMSGYLISTNKPTEVFSNISGVIDSIYCSENSTVFENDIVIRIKSNLSFNDKSELETFLANFEFCQNTDEYLDINFPRGLILGDIAGLYSNLQNEFSNFQYYLNDKTSLNKVRSINNEIDQIKILNSSIEIQKEYFDSTLTYTMNDLSRNRILRAQGVVSEVERENSEVKTLNEKRNVESFKSNIISNKIRIQQLESEVLRIKEERLKDISTKIYQINQLIIQIKEEIKKWERNYIIKSTQDGEISFTKRWAINDYVKAGDHLVTILPNTKNQTFIIEGLLPLKSSGNLEIGQDAIIKFENYPSNQFGFIWGKVLDISTIPTEDNYRVTIEIPRKLITNLKKEIPTKQLLKAVVEINTNEYSLLERMFQNIFSIIKK